MNKYFQNIDSKSWAFEQLYKYIHFEKTFSVVWELRELKCYSKLYINIESKSRKVSTIKKNGRYK